MRAPFPVTLHVLDGVQGHIGAGRKAGFSRGSAPFATYVDDDDYLLPSAFAAIEPAMARSPAAVFTGETQEQNGHRREFAGRHHLAVYRRDVLPLVDLSLWFACADWAMRRAVERHPDGVIDVPSFDYVHRVYPRSPARTIRRARSAELMELARV